MHTETLLLDFMARVNDVLKSDAVEAEKLKAIYRAKRWAENEYAKISFPDGSSLDGGHLIEAQMTYL